jgi:hypothetical protein
VRTARLGGGGWGLAGGGICLLESGDRSTEA